MDAVRPICRSDAPRPAGALPVAGQPHLWFSQAEVLMRGPDGARGRITAAADLLETMRRALGSRRAALAGLVLDRPRIMGVVNVTPDSFSDGGRYLDAGAAQAQAWALVAAGADLLDIGGESTRPGATPVPVETEIARTAPLIAALRAGGLTVPISIDTRKSAVAAAALDAGASMVNDVSAFTFDPGLAALVARRGVPACLMHARGTPETMQQDPRYDDVLLDVYDWLADRVAAAQAAGIPPTRLAVDPGIGFGKTVAHNLALIRGLATFHGLGCAVLLGASRKSFIGALAGEPVAAHRLPGSLAAALAGAAAGAQILRVHDVAETRQALAVWGAIAGAGNLGDSS